MRWLSAEQVVALHEAVLERWGGMPGGGPRGAAHEGVEAAVQAVKNSYYTTAGELAAANAVYIVQGHVFQDGNKRAGAAAAATFLVANGIELRIPPGELRDSMIELQTRAEQGTRTDALIAWLAGRLTGTEAGSLGSAGRRKRLWDFR